MRKLVIFAFSLFCSLGITAQNLDYQILQTVNVNRNVSLDQSMIFISESTTTFALLGPSIMLGSGFILKDKSKFRKGLFAIEVMAVNTAITYGGKYAFDRPRPFRTYNDIVKLTAGGSPSFPSGHTSIAFASATAMTLAYPKWYVAVPSYSWAALVGYSRMHTGVHYPSDVFIGAIVGIASGFISETLNQQLFKSYKRSREY